MSCVFDDFLPSLSKVIEEINNLPSQHLPLEDTIGRIVEILFSNSDLYYVYAKVIQGEKLVVNSVFCRDKREAERFLHNPSLDICWDKPIGIDDYVVVKGEPRIGTSLEKHDTTFSSATFRDAFSVIGLPLRLSSKVIGVLQMAGTDIIEEYLPDKKDEKVLQLHADALELLLSSISNTLNSIGYQKHE